jgi:hypothetical protein
VDSEDNIWLGMRHRGLYFYDHDSGYKQRIISLNEMTVMGVCEDHEGNIWATTQDNGVFMCRNPHILHYPEIPDLNKILYSTYSSTDELMFASHKGRLARVQGLHAEMVDIEGLGYIPLAMEKTGSTYGITTSSGVFLCDTNFTHLREVKTTEGFATGGGRFMAYAGVDSLFQGNRTALSLIHTGVSQTVFEPKDQISQLATLADSSVVVIFLAKDSLLIIHRNLRREWLPCPKGTLMMKNPSKELLFFLTRDALLLATPQGEKDVLRGLGIEVRQVNDVAYDPKTGLWLATSDGLVHVFHDLHHETFTRNEGLPNEKVLEVQLMGNHLYLLTESGLFVVPTSLQKSEDQPVLRTASALVDERNRHLSSDSLILNPEEHQAVFQFDILSFKATPHPLVIEYKVEEFGPEWISANSRKVTLSNLSSRNYHLQVRVAGHEGYLPGKVMRFVIVARPPFWRTAWFQALLVLVGLGLVAWVVRANGQRIRRKEAEKTRINKLIAESQMSALQAHMNPHFIFNVINSIQTYVLESDSQTAYNQLTKFSRVVRSVLEQARQRTIPLSEELALLSSYVELEQLRFSDVFEFRIELAPDIAAAQLRTPPLLLQPFVENAILHGLAPLGKGAKGLLKVQVMHAGDMLRISISDNGIGRAKAARVAQRPDHKSLGTTIMEERINALRLLPGYQTATIKVSDLHPGAENCGTLVEIFLPEKMENLTN